MNPLDILVVDDNRTAADALARVLRKGGDQVRVCYDGASAIHLLQEKSPDIVLTDLKMEPVDGMAVLRAARAQRPPVEVVVFTAYGAVDVAVQAMRLGARDFLTKPVTVDQVAARLKPLRAPVESPQVDFPFVAVSSSAQRLLTIVRRVAAVPSPVWIEGEIGSGRGHVAQALHFYGALRSEPFTIYNPGMGDPWPDAGTVLFPNVGDLPDDLQLALVRQLQSAPATVRLVATSSPGSRAQVAAGALRAELYYSLAVVLLQVPSLRERPEDVLPLFEQVLVEVATRYGVEVPVLGPDVRHRLTGHHWPGNVRELRNLAERVLVLGVDALDLRSVRAQNPQVLPRLQEGFSLSRYLEDTEHRLLVAALDQAHGDRAVAGKLLGVERNTLRYKLKKYGLLE